MMKYCNLVFAKHNEPCGCTYLFRAPLDKEIKDGQEILVRCTRGIQPAVASSPSFLVPNDVGKIITKNHGGYWPLAPVVAIMSDRTVKDVTPIDPDFNDVIKNFVKEKMQNG